MSPAAPAISGPFPALLSRRSERPIHILNQEIGFIPVLKALNHVSSSSFFAFTVLYESFLLAQTSQKTTVDIAYAQSVRTATTKDKTPRTVPIATSPPVDKPPPLRGLQLKELEPLALSLLHWLTLLPPFSLAVEVAAVAEVVGVVPTFTVLPLPLSEFELLFELLFEFCLFPIDAMPLASDLETDRRESSADRAAMSWEGADDMSIRLP